MKFDKFEVARRQLGVALHLFIEDSDPVSVHVLACSAVEIAESLAEAAGQEPFKAIAIDANPELTEQLYRTVKNKWWNSFKHYKRKGGLSRSDQELLADFEDKANDFYLFIGWHDLSKITGQMPAEAQCFMAWFFALQLGGRPQQKPRIEQKEMLRRQIRQYKRDRNLMDDPRRERRKLLLPNNLNQFER